jgi:hypothetical protein
VINRDLVAVFFIVFFSEYPVFPAAFVEEALFSPSCVLGYFVEDQLAVGAWVYVWIFYSDPLVFLSVFVPVPCCFYVFVMAL